MHILKKTLNFIYAHLHFFGLIYVLIFSFILRAPVVLTERLWFDEALYAWYALKIFCHPLAVFSRDVTAYHPPLFSSILALGHFFWPPLMACQIISFIIGLAGIWGIYILGVRVYSRYTGLLCAFLLALNPVYLRYSNKILTEAAFMLALMAVAFFMHRVGQGKGRGDDLWVGVAGMIAVLLKWTGVLVLPWVALYYFVALCDISRSERIRRLTVPLGMILCTIGVLGLNNLVHFGNVFPNLGAVLETLEAEPWNFYLIYFHQIIGGKFFVPFFALGVWFVCREDRKLAVLLLGWLLVFMIAVSFAQERLFRYSLPFLPALLVLTVIGVEKSLTKLLNVSSVLNAGKMVVLVILGVILMSRYPAFARDLREDNKFFNGFEQAGMWIRKHLRKDTLVVASSERAVRYFAQMHIHDDSGKLVKFSRDKESMAGIFRGERHVILELDNYGDTQLIIQPGVDVGYYQGQGFRLVKTTGKMRYSTDTGTTVVAPAVWLFEKK